MDADEFNLDVNNERSLKQLAWGIEASVGQFKLILARCNYRSLRLHLIKRLRDICQVEIRVLVLKESARTLYTAIREESGDDVQALMVLGLESVRNLEQMLISANQVREEFRNHFPFPVVLWIDDEVHKQFMQFAPDLESWGTTKIFPIAPNELMEFLQETAEQFLTGDFSLTLEKYSEIKLAWQDLQNSGQVLEPGVKARIEYLLGFTEFVDNHLDTTLEYYQQSLAFWQQVNDLVWQGKVLSNITFCYYEKARQQERNSPQNVETLPLRVRHSPAEGNPPAALDSHATSLQRDKTEDSDWQETRNYLQQCLQVLESAQRSDLIANLLDKFGKILRELQDWEELKKLAQRALLIHEAEGDLLRVSQDYGFLAEVALANQKWQEAKTLAEKALEVLSTNPSAISNRQEFLFLLAKAQQNLGEEQAAINNLKTAIQIGVSDSKPELYLSLLRNLRSLYLKQKQYLEAFQIKQEGLSVEQQFGLRAFIGAGRLQATRHANLSKIVEKLPATSLQENIAPEISASGRLLDVERLIERIGRPDYKLIVIHGQSGVGKSSLVNAGLVPGLKKKAIGIQDNLVVPIRVYTNWMDELGRQIKEALQEMGRWGDGEAETSALETQAQVSEVETPDSRTTLLKELRECETYNLRPVLIFDQFEEFFFVDIEPQQRWLFFEFLKDCLNILSVNIVLSLREDYLHYLLKFNRFRDSSMIQIDILSENVLYELGNFSRDDAQSIIQQLTERANFHLEPALIAELVRDLARELGEVRPIELQVVGAQLQAENIRTLAKYQECGTKEELVKRYLNEVVQDCGEENQQTAEFVLYLLTDEKGTRPLKTHAELERDLQVLAADLSKDASKLDLILEIFVESGLVVLLKENPTNRYQLVHDYLAEFIRQQQEPKLSQVMAELEQERKQRLQTEEQLKQTEQAKQILTKANQKAQQRIRVGSGVLIASFVVAGIVTLQAFGLVGKAQKSAILERQGVAAEKLFQIQQIEALLLALNAGQDLHNLINKENEPAEYPAASPVLALQTIVDNIHEQNQLKGHTGSLRSASFSPDGKRILTASEDNTTRLWDISGKQLVELKGHKGSINSASFSPDGKRILTASDDQTARVWDSAGKQLAELKGHKGSVVSASFSPDGKRILTVSSDNTARVWDSVGKPLAELKGHTGPVNSASFSPDGKRILTVSSDKTARLWDSAGKPLAELKGDTVPVNRASFSPDGKRILTGSDDTVRLWDTSGKQIAQLKGHTSSVISASFSPDGKRILTASDDTVRLWDTSGKQIAQIKGNTSSVISASFSPDGKRILTASDDMARLWNLSGKQIAQLKWPSGSIYSTSFSPDGKRILTVSSDNTARLWDMSEQIPEKEDIYSNFANYKRDGKRIFAASSDSAPVWDSAGKQLAELKEDTSAVNTASFSPDGKRILTASNNRRVRLWDSGGKQLAEFKGHTDNVNSASFSPDGKRILTASDSTTRLWDSTGKQFTELKKLSGVYSAIFSPDGKRILTASSDKTARLWDSSGKLLAELKGHTSDLNSASFSPDGKRIVTASWDKTARVWDSTGKQLAELKGHTGFVLNASFSPDGKRILTASSDNTARLWDISGKLLAELKGHKDNVNSAIFSPDGKRILTASWDTTARLWDSTGKQLAELKGHTSGVYSAVFSPDGKRILTASDDRTARVWDSAGKQLAELKGHTGSVLSASFSPDGKRILTASWDRTARVWQYTTFDELLSQGCQWLDDYFVINPKELEKLEVCQNKSNLKAAAPFLVKEGEQQARAGNIDEAIATFRKALQWNPNLKFDPKEKAQELANKGEAERLVACRSKRRSKQFCYRG
ncbi:nSTAND1 domain-containing NTPase [Brasilonema octagenarum]|uniref:Ribosome assembly protein 4 n=1 Tax=Brasilonema octagenarum UFV-OR1 TaxID=417115 RepID=A0ABX1MAV5_9CYAN|nr:ribosome assembly protein 4 [Brasilonema octagenarum]NMF64636.1 ribosome assembly protein 4 [Brasilonema octagenarum UFV-OR1]